MKQAFNVLVFLRDDDTYYARVEGFKNVFAYAPTLKLLFERLQESIKLALSVEED